MPRPAGYEEVSDFVMSRLHQMLARVISNPRDSVSGVAREAVVLHAEPSFNISLAHVDRQPGFLYWTPTPAHIYKMDEEVAYVARYKVPADLDNAVVDRRVRLQSVGRHSLLPGNLIERDGTTDVIDFELPGRGIFLLRIQAAPLASFDWLFDRTTFAAVGAAAIELQSTQIVNLLKISPHVGRPPSLEILERATHHRDHSVRWAAVKAIALVDRANAGDVLHRLASDPHPHVRASARRGLQQLAG